MSAPTIADLSGLDQFKNATQASHRLCVVHFHAPWAAQCKPMDDAMRILAGEEAYKAVAFARVEADEQPEISMEYDVAAVPTLIFFEGK